jgi:hypothetical protein
MDEDLRLTDAQLLAEEFGADALRGVGEVGRAAVHREGLDAEAVEDPLELPDVGEALAWLADLRFREGRLDPDEEGRRLVAWWEGR